MFIDETRSLNLFENNELNNVIHPQILKIIENFNNGFMDGITWPVEWDAHGNPGGPWVYSGRNLEMRIQSELENKMWCRGWHDGRALRDTKGRPRKPGDKYEKIQLTKEEEEYYKNLELELYDIVKDIAMALTGRKIKFKKFKKDKDK